MKATLEFNLPEDDVEHLTAVHAMNLKMIIDELGDKLRSKIKYTDERQISFEALRKIFWETVNDSPAAELFR